MFETKILYLVICLLFQMNVFIISLFYHWFAFLFFYVFYVECLLSVNYFNSYSKVKQLIFFSSFYLVFSSLNRHMFLCFIIEFAPGWSFTIWTFIDNPLDCYGSSHLSKYLYWILGFFSNSVMPSSIQQYPAWVLSFFTWLLLLLEWLSPSKSL